MNQEIQPEAPKVTPTETVSVTSEEKTFAVIAYISILCLVALFLKKDSAFVQAHAKQGLLLFIASIIINIIGSIIPYIGWNLIIPIGHLLILACAIIGIVHVVQNKYWKIPFGVGDWADKMKI